MLTEATLEAHSRLADENSHQKMADIESLASILQPLIVEAIFSEIEKNPGEGKYIVRLPRLVRQNFPKFGASNVRLRGFEYAKNRAAKEISTHMKSLVFLYEKNGFLAPYLSVHTSSTKATHYELACFDFGMGT